MSYEAVLFSTADEAMVRSQKETQAGALISVFKKFYKVEIDMPWPGTNEHFYTMYKLAQPGDVYFVNLKDCDAPVDDLAVIVARATVAMGYIRKLK